MKVSKPTILFLPKLLVEKLDYCLEKNKPNFSYKTIYFHYAIYYIIDKKNRYKKYQFVAINKQKLSGLTVSNIIRYIKYLEKYEFIINDKQYNKGLKSYWYKINPGYNKGFKQIEIPINSKMYSKIKNVRINADKNQSKSKPFLYSMFKHFKKMEFDYENAEKWINKNVSESKKVYYLSSINQLKDINFRRFKRNKTNSRLDTNLTNLSKDLRQFIKGNLISIDLSNSQPFLLSILLNSIININNKQSITLCYYFSYKRLVETFGKKQLHEILKIRKNAEKSKNTNLSMFYEATTSGLFYDNFIKEYEKNITRSEVKDIMFKVMFSKNVFYKNYHKIIPYEKEKNIFKKVYPFVYDAIEILKQNDNAKLSIYLQKVESYIFIDCIAKELVTAGIIPLTIHDSIIIKKEHQKKALQIMEQVFIEQIGVIPTFKTEKL